MAKYEYHHIQQRVGLTGVLNKDTLVKLNRLGKEGWEVVNVENPSVSFHSSVLLKRRCK